MYPEMDSEQVIEHFFLRSTRYWPDIDFGIQVAYLHAF